MPQTGSGPGAENSTCWTNSSKWLKEAISHCSFFPSFLFPLREGQSYLVSKKAMPIVPHLFCWILEDILREMGAKLQMAERQKPNVSLALPLQGYYNIIIALRCNGYRWAENYDSPMERNRVELISRCEGIASLFTDLATTASLAPNTLTNKTCQYLDLVTEISVSVWPEDGREAQVGLYMTWNISRY